MGFVYSQIAWVIPVIPLLAFLTLTAFGRQMRGAAVLLSILSSFASFVLSGFLLWERAVGTIEDYAYNFDWIRFGDFQLKVGFEVTNLSAFMLIIITLISILVNIYSIGYMRDDERRTVFYAYIALFTSSMLALVLSPNLLQLYVFWELVGVCSFLLIGFWYERPAARAAAKKAFIVTRLGDVGLFIALLLLFWNMPNHTLDFGAISHIFSNVNSLAQSGISTGLATWIASLIFVGAVGKSGQFPLHTWLPDAMEGPTPISALIHAATMVAAGVYLIARTFDIFNMSSTALTIVASIGGFTAIFAATIAIVQRNLKHILAYSTISQLGYMMMAMGLGAKTAGLFHLFTHALFKALLFLAVGSVIHIIHTQDIFYISGIGRKMKVTMCTFGIGALALSGVPPLSGFWSKDAILLAAWDRREGLLFVIGVITAFLTAFSMARLFFLVFMGKPSAKSGADNIHESPLSMTIPLIVLSILTIVVGFVYIPLNDKFGTWLTGEQATGHISATVIFVSMLVSILGIVVGYVKYGPKRRCQDKFEHSTGAVYRLLINKYYINELYGVVFVRPLAGFGRFLQVIDKWVIEGGVRLVVWLVVGVGKTSIRSHSGQLQTYGLLSLFGFVGLLMFVLTFGRGIWR